MIITIFDRTGNARAEVAPADSSVQSKKIQGDNVLSLSFTLFDHISLDVDDYVDFEGERYWLCEKYRPVQKSTLEWQYNIRLYGIESLLRNILVIKRVDGEDEPVFTLTAPPREHVAMIVNCMNDGGRAGADWKVGQVDGAENIVIDYFGKYCDEALSEIADKVGVEYWVEGHTVNVCRCQHGESITLAYDKGLTSIDPDRADNVKFYTRLYPVGSSRNIDPAKYGHSRLQLPEGKKYVEVNADRYGRVDHYEEDAFAGIYPRRIGQISDVRSVEKFGEDGNPFTIYYFKDSTLNFDPNSYEIAGLVKRVSFQEGSELAGLGAEEDGTFFFEVNFDSASHEFEIITTWPYDDGTQLPGGSLIPKVGDRYILWNIRMPDEYYTLAEAEFAQAVTKYNDEHALDITVFKATTDHVWIEDNQADLFVGRRVRLESVQFFPDTGFRDSRITMITRRVNLPSQMDIEIGDALSRSSRQKFSDDISEARNYATSIAGSVALPDIIRTGDRTEPTDNNLYSARRIDRSFLSKLKDDRAKGKIASDIAFEIGNYLAGNSGGIFGIDKSDGQSFAEVARLFVRGKAFFESLTIIEAGAIGGKRYLTPGGAVKCTAVAEKGLVEVTKTRPKTDEEGNPVVDENGQPVMEEYTEMVDNGIPEGVYRCYFLSEQDGERTDTKIISGDQAISEMFNAASGEGNKLSNHRYWRFVTGVSNDAYTDSTGNHYGYIDLSKTDCESGSDAPKAGDTIEQFGNRTDTSRQAAMVLDTVGPDAPSIKMLTGIGSGESAAEHYSLEGKKIIAQGFDHTKGRAFFRCLGDARIGDPDGSNIDYADNHFSFNNVTASTTAMVDGVRKTLAGMNGEYSTELGGRTIGSWWGGPMVDLFDADGSRRTDLAAGAYATSLVRLDGSFYFCNGNFGGRPNGSAWIGGENGMEIDESGHIIFGSGIQLNFDGSNQGLIDTLQNLANFNLGLSELLIPCDKDGTPLEGGWADALKPDGTTNADGTKGILAKSLRSRVGFWSVDFISCLGLNDDTGGGTGGNSYDLLESWNDYDATHARDALSAALGYDLHLRVRALENSGSTGGGSEISVSVTGTGNAITAISNNGPTINAVKGENFALADHVHSGYVPFSVLDNYYSKSESDNRYALIVHTHSQYLTGITRSMVESVLTGNVTSHYHSQYLLASAYTAQDVLSKLKTVDGHTSGLDADTLDGYHGADYLRSFWSYNPGYDCSTHNDSSLASFTYANNAPFTGAVVDISVNGYGFYLGTAVYSDNALYYRRHGSAANDGGMGGWQQLARVTDNVASASKLAAGSKFIEWDAANGAWKVDGDLYATGNITALGFEELSAVEAKVGNLTVGTYGQIQATEEVLGIRHNNGGEVVFGSTARFTSGFFLGDSGSPYCIDEVGVAVLASVQIGNATFTQSGSEVYVTIGSTRYKLTKTTA